MRCGGRASPKRPERRANPFAAFADRLVGQAHHGKGKLAGRDHHLHVDRQDIDALESYRSHRCLHVDLQLRLGEQL